MSRATPANRTDSSGARTPRFGLLAAGLALLVCCARIGWVLHGLPEAPIYDEWSAIDGIALANVDGAFHPGYLYATHNEHVLVWTKLLDWIQLHLSDNQFDARPAGLLLALLTGLAAAMLLAAGARRLEGGRAAFLVAGVGLVALPYAWENLTEGWGDPYAMLIAGAFATLWIALYGRRLRAVPTMIAAAVFSVLSMGSGCVAPVLGAGIVLLRLRAGDLRRSVAAGMLVAQSAAVAFAVVLLAGRAHAAEHVPRNVAIGLVQGLVVAIAFVPAWWLGRRIVVAMTNAKCTNSSRDDAFAAVLALWGFLHVGAMIAIRPEFRIWLPFSRYMDIIAFAALANLYCALRLAPKDVGVRAHRLIGSGAKIFAALTLLAAPLPLSLYTWQADRFVRAQTLIGDVVQRGDTDAIDRAGADELAFPDRAYLKAHLADPRVRRILGDRIGTRPQPAPAVAASRMLEEGLLRHARLLCAGAVLAAAWLIQAAFRRREDAAESGAENA